MVAKEFQEILRCSVALILRGAKFLKCKSIAVIYIVACLVVVLLLLWLSSCTSNHYFSINAEEISNPSIEYRDSTALYNPF